MRDHALLCFRIEDKTPDTYDTYEVVLQELNTGHTLSLTVTQFFFVNAPLKTRPRTEYAITVNKVGEPDKKIRFRYNAYDWNDDNLYIFQLDRKRQLSGKDYSLEYVTGYMDEDGYVQKETVTLPLREKSFQSFYLPTNRDLLDVILVGDENKLRINKNRLSTPKTVSTEWRSPQSLTSTNTKGVSSSTSTGWAADFSRSTTHSTSRSSTSAASPSALPLSMWSRSTTKDSPPTAAL